MPILLNEIALLVGDLSLLLLVNCLHGVCLFTEHADLVQDCSPLDMTLFLLNRLDGRVMQLRDCP